ncbi:MYND-type zinc finger protein samB [Abortiporus biennis]
MYRIAIHMMTLFLLYSNPIGNRVSCLSSCSHHLLKLLEYLIRTKIMAMFGNISVVLLKRMPCNRDTSLPWIEMTEFFLCAHSMLLQRYKNGCADEVTRYETYFSKLLPIWYSTLQGLRACRNITPDQIRCHQVVQVWAAFSEQIGISEDNIQEQLQLNPSPREPPKWMTYHRKECLCHNERVHHRMRVCKGCRRVVYCGIDCQTKDWIIGRRKERCRRWRLNHQDRRNHNPSSAGT